MSAAAEILVELDARNVRPVLVGDKLKLRGPADRITPELVERVRVCKTELLGLLAAEREQAEIERIARLDAERREADRHAKRGDDYDPTPQSHVERQESEIDRLASIDGWRLPRAQRIITSCQRYGVALRRAGSGRSTAVRAWCSLRLLSEHGS